MTEFCKVIQTPGGIIYHSAMLGNSDINAVVENDKLYGSMHPRNGLFFTFRIVGTHDEEITEKEMVRAVQLAFDHWSKRANVIIKQAQVWDQPDFRIIFRTTLNDERGELTDNTIMYHFFPINDVSNPLRGLCVVNSDFYYSTHGKAVSMHEIDPDHYDNNTNASGRTIDIDQVFTHEFGHGFGLPHDKELFQVMSPNHGFMAEFPTERDVFRMVKKYGVPKKSKSWFSRWFRYLRYRSNNY